MKGKLWLRVYNQPKFERWSRAVGKKSTPGRRFLGNVVPNRCSRGCSFQRDGKTGMERKNGIAYRASKWVVRRRQDCVRN